MKSKYYFFLLIISIAFHTACKQAIPVEANQNHLKHFGFTLIDTYWDDPTDSATKSNYIDEVYTFSNLADILVVNETDNIVQNVQLFESYDVKAILHLNDLFFEYVDSIAPSNSNYDLRTDYKARWNNFVQLNSSVLSPALIGAFYVGEEPTWNGIEYESLNKVTELVKTDFPNVPVMIVEAYPTLSDLKIPSKADWIGFDRYFIKRPNEDVDYQKNWNILKSKLTEEQKAIVVLDAHYIDWAHGDFGNIDLNEMGTVAQSYYQLAKNDKKTIGILGYFWPNGFDDSNSIGARGMPQIIKNEYIKIGKEITRKP